MGSKRQGEEEEEEQWKQAPRVPLGREEGKRGTEEREDVVQGPTGRVEKAGPFFLG